MMYATAIHASTIRPLCHQLGSNRPLGSEATAASAAEPADAPAAEPAAVFIASTSTLTFVEDELTATSTPAVSTFPTA